MILLFLQHVTQRDLDRWLWGEKEDGKTHIVASESSALSAIGAKLKRDIVPGELVKLSKNGVETEMFSSENIQSSLFF